MSWARIAISNANDQPLPRMSVSTNAANISRLNILMPVAQSLKAVAETMQNRALVVRDNVRVIRSADEAEAAINRDVVLIANCSLPATNVATLLYRPLLLESP